MYRATTVLIKKGHRLHDYCKEVCTSSAKLYNRADFILSGITSLKIRCTR